MAYKYYDVEADFKAEEKKYLYGKKRGFLMQRILQKKGKDNFGLSIQRCNLLENREFFYTQSNPQNLQLPEFSDSYMTLNAQVAYQFNKHIRAYFGGENLTGYQQTNPILDAQNPFGNYFDGGMVYAPIMPANLYVGLDVNFLIFCHKYTN